ncbi:hypothetical protein [Haloplanus rubicundus]|uniref:hypothetical protein n=1 Tax=Haloplanus rubicundus TaxID=1547898 RepID=UPI001300AB8E|nr:hypothetical protein [Haloplanus rubicundus]
MELDKQIMERLAFAKSLQQEAVQKSNKPQPMAASSVLSFHDSVEIFFYTSAEYLGINADPNHITEYFEEIKREIGEDLVGKAGVKRLNKVRKNLKHKASLPDELEINAFQSTVSNFFVENTPKIFDVEYSEVGVEHLVKFDRTRESLVRASEKYKFGNIKEAMGHLALAHNDLLSEHQNATIREIEYRSFPDYPGFEFEGDRFGKLDQFFEDLSEAIMYVSLGIDYRRYSRFKHLTPSIVINNDIDEYQKYRPYFENYKFDEIGPEEYHFCKDFVVELSLSLQEAPFEEYDGSEFTPDESVL